LTVAAFYQTLLQLHQCYPLQEVLASPGGYGIDPPLDLLQRITDRRARLKSDSFVKICQLPHGGREEEYRERYQGRDDEGQQTRLPPEKLRRCTALVTSL
jgi:hypothetical protein